MVVPVQTGKNPCAAAAAATTTSTLRNKHKLFIRVSDSGKTINTLIIYTQF
jgi:hypothetical protein